MNRRAYLRFNVAVNANFKNAVGEVQEVVDFIPVVLWGAPAENLAKFLRKGSPVLIEGRIKTGSYTARDGSKRYTTDVHGDNVILLGSKDSSGFSGGYNSQQRQSGGGAVDDDWVKNVGGGSNSQMRNSNPNQDFSNAGGFGESLNDRPFDDNFDAGFDNNNLSSDGADEIPF